MSRRNNVDRRDIKRLETKNKNVVFVLEELNESYVIYLESYDTKIDFIFSSDDEDFMRKTLTFMVESYNEGFIDGKNNSIMFMNGV